MDIRAKFVYLMDELLLNICISVLSWYEDCDDDNDVEHYENGMYLLFFGIHFIS